MNTQKIIIALIVLALIGGGAYFLSQQGSDTEVVVTEPTNDDVMPVEPDGGIGDGAEPLPEMMDEEMTERGEMSIIGTSANGADIVARHIGDGDTEILLVGGVHGGYSANTVSLMEQVYSHFDDAGVPENVTLTIIETFNPDSTGKSGLAGRLNGNDVDLNRNFNCDWSATGVWGSQEVSGGSAAFSEPEAAALRDYVAEYDPAVAIVWFSAEGKVYPSACGGSPSSASVALANTFGSAAGYSVNPTEDFSAYTVTGDMVNWMASEGIPAISVLLSDHQSAELSKNRAGIEAVLAEYGN